ncbi:cation:proton antiporter [Mesorhizobium sp. BAC0120]|uniref:cation:proton antiporter n=1 Tax=Mesorhizobium sp. BAC0120 TaxID=3090670 RepID=UPI00298C17DF|nr:cation:proton antiporter [Mesorhizobium sp. BAC0120]MDW6023532.1 cation:proton antiporter [Mesorhizobium sp. BAC0120]
MLLAAWLPLLLKELPLSLPIIFVGLGAVLMFWLPVAGPDSNPIKHGLFVEKATELVLIVALMGAGLKLDRPFSWRRWAATWRLLSITMLLSVAGLAAAAMVLLDLDAATALLLAALLSPTDPVLASDVEVGPPNSGKEDEVRFALTSEAGLNDGFAFPFVHLAILLAGLTTVDQLDNLMLQWFAIDVVWKIACGVGAGFVTGRLLGWLVFRIPNRARLARSGDGFVALGITCLTYGLTETIGGYGFVTVFVSGLSLRAVERRHDYHERLHDFAEQMERLIMMVLLLLFGAALVDGVLAELDRPAILFTAAAILLIRPVAGALAFIGFPRPWDERAVMAFYGIRGVGSAYYLSYALNHGSFSRPDYLWSVTSLTILISIILHGMTVTPVMRYLDRRRRRLLDGSN